MKSAEIDPRRLKPNRWNTNVVSPDNEKKLDESLRRLGVFKPVLVRTLPNDDLEIIGGAHRVESAIRIGLKSIPVVNLGEIDDHKAKEIGLVDNGRYGADDVVSLAELMSELGSAADLASFLPYTDAEMTAIFSSTDIDLDMLDGSDDDEAPLAPIETALKTHTIMRFKVPLGDAERLQEAIESVMKRQGFTDSDDLTNAGDALVWLFNEYLKGE